MRLTNGRTYDRYLLAPWFVGYIQTQTEVAKQVLLLACRLVHPGQHGQLKMLKMPKILKMLKCNILSKTNPLIENAHIASIACQPWSTLIFQTSPACHTKSFWGRAAAAVASAKSVQLLSGRRMGPCLQQFHTLQSHPTNQTINQSTNQWINQIINQYNTMLWQFIKAYPRYPSSIANSSRTRTIVHHWDFATAASKARARCGHSAPMSCSYWSFPIQCCCWDLVLSYPLVMTNIAIENDHL